MRESGDLHAEVMRSPLGRVRGLGAARSGVAAWWAERITSVALLPLTLWFVFSVLTRLGASQADIRLWIGQPVNTVLMLSLIAITFHHMRLGLQVVIEDYVHRDAARIALLLLVKAACGLLALTCFVATLKMAFVQ